jgi:hypothetical protein
MNLTSQEREVLLAFIDWQLDSGEDTEFWQTLKDKIII